MIGHFKKIFFIMAFFPGHSTIFQDVYTMKKSSGLVLLKSGTGIRMWVIITGSAVNLCHTRTNGQTCLLKGPICFENWVGII